MATHVYANGDEISCKKSTGKTSVAFPDPCWSPPTPPAGPIVLPYPNTAKPSSLKKGTTTVMIKNSMVALERKSFFSKSNGNEPATQAFQKGVLTRKLTGKTFYQKWSMNVKFEGKGVCRHIDLMTHNHGSQTGNTATFPFLAQMITDGGQDPCSKERKTVEDNCGPPENATDEVKKNWDWSEHHCSGELGLKNSGKRYNTKNKEVVAAQAVLIDGDDEKNIKTNNCLKAKRCELVPYANESNSPANYRPSKNARKDQSPGCCPSQTGHHLLPHARVHNSGSCKGSGFSYNSAPTVCAEGGSHSIGTHGDLHKEFSLLCENHVITVIEKVKNSDVIPKIKLDDYIDLAAQSHTNVFPEQCSKECIKAQLSEYYQSKCQGAQIDPCSQTGGKMGKEQRERIFAMVAKECKSGYRFK